MKLSRTSRIVLLISGTIAIDQISKVVIRAKMNYGQEIELIGQKFVLQYVNNKGAFLGMGSDLNPVVRLIFLLILPVVVLGYLIYYIFKNKQLENYALIALCMIAGGGIANVYDRIISGHVTDFLHIDLGGVFRTGIFNLADMAVTSGMILILFGSLLHRRKKS